MTSLREGHRAFTALISFITILISFLFFFVRHNVLKDFMFSQVEFIDQPFQALPAFKKLGNRYIGVIDYVSAIM